MRYEVETESGSRYTIDTARKVMRRERATEPPKDPEVYMSLLKNDGQDVPYYNLFYPVEVGSYVGAVWLDGGRPRVRLSTKITAVREIE